MGKEIASVKGIAERVVNLKGNRQFLLTLGVRETSINGKAHQLGERITFRLDYSEIKTISNLETLLSISVGDWVFVTSEKGPKGTWSLIDINYEPSLGRDANDWLNDVAYGILKH